MKTNTDKQTPLDRIINSYIQETISSEIVSISEDQIRDRISNFSKLQSLIGDSIPQIYSQIGNNASLGWVLRDSIINPSDWTNGYLNSLELNLNSINGKITDSDLRVLTDRLIKNEFWEAFSEIQTLGAICRSRKLCQVEKEKSLPDCDLYSNLDFKISQLDKLDIYVEVSCPFSTELDKDWDETAKWKGIGSELMVKIYRKFNQKNLLNITSSFPVFLVLNTTRLLDNDSVHISEINNPASENYVFQSNVHCSGIFMYKLQLKWGKMEVIPNYVWSPNCPDELKEEIKLICEHFM